jgi:enterochelin esterase-like enzyme
MIHSLRNPEKKYLFVNPTWVEVMNGCQILNSTMKKTHILFLLVFISGALSAQTFSQFIEYLDGLPQGDRQAKVDSFFSANHSYPLIELDMAVHFIYKGTPTSVKVAGDFTGWNPSMNMARVAGTDLWYITSHYEVDARLDYKYVINSSDWILDPRNPYTCTGGFGPNSELRMPGYQSPPEIAYYSGIPHGTMWDSSFYCKPLGGSRTVTVYLPPGYTKGATAYPVILFHDGQDYISLGAVRNILDYLIANHLITGVIAVFVPPVDRHQEYAGSKIETFTSFIVDGVMPEIDRKFSTSREPRNRAVCGASDGGNISLYLGLKHPEVFGKIAAQSSSVSTSIAEGFRDGNKLDLLFYIDIGTYDISELIPMVRDLKQILQNRNYDYQYREWNEGHSWGNWKGHLSYPLKQFFPYTSGLNENKFPGNIRLYQNQPNPFSTETAIRFSAPEGCNAELDLYDVSGRRLCTLFSGKAAPEKNLVLVQGSTLASGTYFYTLRVDHYSLSRQMNVIQ